MRSIAPQGPLSPYAAGVTNRQFALSVGLVIALLLGAVWLLAPAVRDTASGWQECPGHPRPIPARWECP